MSLIKNKVNKFDAGGSMPMSMAEPWFARRSDPIKAYNSGGLYNTFGGGRTDNIANLVPAGAYVMPADVVSGLGEGNTHSGAAILDKMFHSNPHGIEGSHVSGGHGVGMPTSKPPAGIQFAKGGEIDKHKGTHVPIIAAGGEFLINPDAIIRKFGSLDRGHKILDEWVVHTRKKTAKTMLKLKPPVGSKTK